MYFIFDKLNPARVNNDSLIIFMTFVIVLIKKAARNKPPLTSLTRAIDWLTSASTP